MQALSREGRTPLQKAQDPAAASNPHTPEMIQTLMCAPTPFSRVEERRIPPGICP